MLFSSVVAYDVSRGTLVVEHAYPQNTLAPLRTTVDVNLVLETLPTQHLEIGGWLNVIGYVRRNQSKVGKRSFGEVIVIQALLLWSAGPIKVGEYERALSRRKNEREGVVIAHRDV